MSAEPANAGPARLSCLTVVDAVQMALRDSQLAVSTLEARLRRAEEDRSAVQARSEAVARLATDYIRIADERIAAALRRVAAIEEENRFLLDLAGRARPGDDDAPPPDRATG